MHPLNGLADYVPYGRISICARQKFILSGDNRIIKGVICMDLFWTIVVILVILWLLGFSFGLLGSLIHILLVIAIIVVLVRIIQGRKPLG